uniref:Uncharacterized protein n=1 Tax=Zea mays TaxID=4577 RepID=C0PLI5_MAIZE|nr:unknown [Zea mays]
MCCLGRREILGPSRLKCPREKPKTIPPSKHAYQTINPNILRH